MRWFCTSREKTSDIATYAVDYKVSSRPILFFLLAIIIFHFHDLWFRIDRYIIITSFLRHKSSTRLTAIWHEILKEYVLVTDGS